MDWILFGNVVVVLLCVFVLAAPCVAALRSLRRRPASVLAVFAAASLVATIEAQKTNGVNNLPPTPMPPRSLPPTVATVTEEDVARGWRIESVTTNETYSFAMPSDASYVGNWHIHGARSSFGNNAIDFGSAETPRPTSWSFPLGTNGAAFSSFWYFVDGRIRPTPKDAEHEVCAVGVPMSAVPGQSRLWIAEEPDDSRVLTWENFFLNGDTNAPVNAQIRLFANGDFTTRSNGVETICRRVNPHDWDGDGLANEKDENPLVYDGEFFGVANTMPTNANLDAYYQLDVAAVGALDYATIRVTCDGPSDLGDHVIIARTNQVCHVSLLAGATYTVESDLPIAYSAVSSEYANIVTNSATSLTVSLPLEFSLERIQTRSVGRPYNYGVLSYPINVFASVLSCAGGCCSPQVVDGTMQWACSSVCTCGGTSHCMEVEANWEGYSKMFIGYVTCGCGEDAPDPDPTPSIGPLLASVSVSFSKDAVIFEDAYENLPGEWVSRRSTATTLTIHANGGTNGAVLAVSATNLGKLQKNAGPAFPTQSVSVPANHSVTYEMNYVGAEASVATNDVAVTATLTENGGGVLSDSATLSVVEVRMLADVTAPSNSCPKRHVYGVHEMVNVELQPTGTVAVLQFDSNAGFSNFDYDCFWCPWTGGVYTVSFISGDAEFSSQVNVMDPVPVAVDAWWDGVEGTPGSSGNVAMNIELLLAPFTVSFMGVWVVEIPDEAENCPHFGYFDNPTYGRPWSHTSGAGAGEWFLVTQRNEWTHDRAGTLKNYPPPWSTGWKEWDIPIGWSDVVGVVKGRNRPNSVTERFEIDETGTVTVRKFGHWIRRATDNHVWVDGTRVH